MQFILSINNNLIPDTQFMKNVNVINCNFDEIKIYYITIKI